MDNSHPAPPGTWLALVALTVGVVWAAWLGTTRRVLPESGPAPTRTVAGAPVWPDMRIDINEAGPAELDLLPGIGPKLAERITADRSALGRFTSVSDLQRVSGVGPVTVERIRPYVVAGEKGVGVQGPGFGGRPQPRTTNP